MTYFVLSGTLNFTN